MVLLLGLFDTPFLRSVLAHCCLCHGNSWVCLYQRSVHGCQLLPPLLLRRLQLTQRCLLLLAAPRDALVLPERRRRESMHNVLNKSFDKSMLSVQCCTLAKHDACMALRCRRLLTF